jgi:hypothetical protein
LVADGRFIEQSGRKRRQSVANARDGALEQAVLRRCVRAAQERRDREERLLDERPGSEDGAESADRAHCSRLAETGFTASGPASGHLGLHSPLLLGRGQAGVGLSARVEAPN